MGVRTSSSTRFKRPSRPRPLSCGGHAPRRRAPEQCTLRDRPGPPALMSHSAGCRASWGKASIITGSRHATPPSQPAAHACMDQACKQVHAICSQRSDFFEAGCSGSIVPTGQILMSNSAGGSQDFCMARFQSVARKSYLHRPLFAA